MTKLTDPADELAWLPEEPEDTGCVTGYDRSGWEDSVWVLHAMWERPGSDDQTYHEWRQQQIAAGRIAPTVAGGINLDDGPIATGVTLGYRSDPGQGWSRLRWAELAGRMGLTLGGDDPSVPPCHRWFPVASWPVTIEPPTEGSLDETGLRALLEVLTRYSDSECHAYYAAVPTGEFDHPTLLRGPLDAVPDLVAKMSTTPSNIWPVDRSWFVYTDWDLWATKVSGSRELIAAVAAHPELESVRWNR